MRWESRQPVDLAAAVAAPTVLLLVVAALPDSPLRVALGLPLVLFLPGYALLAVLFPRFCKEEPKEAPKEGAPRRGIDGLERIALSFGLSIAVVPLLGLALNFTPFGIRLWSVLATLWLFVAAMGGLAAWLRLRMPAEQRPVWRLDLAPPAWRSATKAERALMVGVVASLLVSVGVLGYVLATPRPGEAFTEFYLLGPGGKAEGYPTRLNASEEGLVLVGVVNHEGSATSYEARLLDQPAAREGANATVLGEGQEVWRQAIVLGPGEAWEGNVTFRAEPGFHRLQFELRRAGDVEPYRRLHLWVEVAGAP